MILIGGNYPTERTTLARMMMAIVRIKILQVREIAMTMEMNVTSQSVSTYKMERLQSTQTEELMKIQMKTSMGKKQGIGLLF